MPATNRMSRSMLSTSAACRRPIWDSGLRRFVCRTKPAPSRFLSIPMRKRQGRVFVLGSCSRPFLNRSVRAEGARAGARAEAPEAEQAAAAAGPEAQAVQGRVAVVVRAAGPEAQAVRVEHAAARVAPPGARAAAAARPEIVV